MPQTCLGVSATLLNPRNTWADKEAYDKKAKELVSAFTENFNQFKNAANAAIQ
jgi:phosphoenolpyruvate carboxykinase (ATP)